MTKWVAVCSNGEEAFNIRGDNYEELMEEIDLYGYDVLDVFEETTE